MTPVRKIAILYTDAGGGHLATARALAAVLERQTPHQVSLINPYQELIADIDLFPRFSGYTDEEVYNRFVLGHGWPNLLCQLYFGLTMLNVKLGTRRAVQRFTARWRQDKPDLVISVMPLANQGIYRSLQAFSRKSPVPLLVVISDLWEEMRRVWFPKEQDYFIACGSEQAYNQALVKPHPKNLIFRTSGLIVHPDFYNRPPTDRAAERIKLGLRPDWPTGCMMYGSAGSLRMTRLARVLARMDRPGQMIFMCGRNQALAEALRKLNLPYPHLILPYTTQVPYYFGLSDFLVCKPGPGTISEALVSGLSLLVDRRNILPQERYNIAWLHRKRLGLSFNSAADFQRAVLKLLSPDREVETGLFRPGEPENRSVFELPLIIRQILDKSGSG